jgi:hypothetical protein
LNVLGFTSPENVGMNPLILNKIEADSKQKQSMERWLWNANLVARKGKVIYQKSFGYQTYDKKSKVANTDVYDVASLTKIYLRLPNVMLQYDQQKINMETRLDSMLLYLEIQIRKTYTLRSYCRMPDCNLDSFYKATVDKRVTFR